LVAVKRARASRTGSQRRAIYAGPDNQLRKILRDAFAVYFIIGCEDQDGLGDAEVAENEETLAVCRLLKQAGRFRRTLGMISEQKSEQYIRVEQIFFH
jgi:hypothetical protein